MQVDRGKPEMRRENRPRMELLAPAGSFEALKAAVENGADAVYLGGKMFNARASASNFDLEEMKRALAYAHERRVKVYVTVNILVADREFPQLADYLYELYSLGTDALIVQDIGVAHFIKEVLPEMEIHASTQMTQNNSFGLRQLEKMGFSRVVLARETSAAEIEEIIQKTKLNVEAFAHGALCISYSGQCLMSSYIGARSGNRGRCAQPCRLTYQLVDERGRNLLLNKKLGDHLLSPRDLNLSGELAKLQKLGVSALKIEGRMKRPEYVATVTRIYRKALDNLELNLFQGLDDQEKHELTQIFNRDFTTGYFTEYQGREMMSYSRPNNRGTRLGRILEVKNNCLTIKLENKLNIGDGLEIWTGRGREGITVGKIANAAGQSVHSGSQGESVKIEFTGSARVGDRVFKTYDEELMEKAKLSFQEGKETRKRPLKMKLSGRIGQKLSLEVRDGESQVKVESLSQAQEALNRPLDYDYLYKQLGRLGNTPFSLQELELDLEGRLIIPVKEINELRRMAIEMLLETSPATPLLDKKVYQERIRSWNKKIAVLSNFERKKASFPVNVNEYHAPALTAKIGKRVKESKLSVAVTDIKMVNLCIRAGADRIILGGEHWRSRPVITLNQLREIVDACSAKGVKLIWRLPRICNEEQSSRILRELKEIAEWSARPIVMAGNLAEIEMIQSLDSSWTWETDYFIPVFNQAALHRILEEGARLATLSTELSYEQLHEFLHEDKTEMIVFGDMEMMVSEYCLIGSTLAEGQGNPRDNCGRACHSKTYYLKDRLAYNFPLDTDRECRMHIFNAKRLNLVTELAKIADVGIRNIRLELHRVSLEQAASTVGIFKKLWIDAAYGKINREKTEEAMKSLEDLYPEGFTKGHFYRGVLT